jgi:hypothetical protein
MNIFFKAVLLISYSLLITFSSNYVYANGTVRVSVEPDTFDVTYTQNKPLKGNTTFTPSVWHEDKPSGPFNTCVKSNRVNFQVSKLVYPYRVLTDKDTYPRFEGEKTSVVYAWAENGASPGELQIRRVYMSAAKKLGAKVLVDRSLYTAFELTESGKTTYFAIEIFNDGRDINFMSIEPEEEN